jgi:hypothetical protein
MYIQYKHGFIEADRWDGNMDMPLEHVDAICAAHASIDAKTIARSVIPLVVPVIVVRSRDHETIDDVLTTLRCQVTHSRIVLRFHTPEWDYPWRAYVTVHEWARVLADVALGIDYRNFKKWCAAHANERDQYLAHAIWRAASAGRS